MRGLSNDMNEPRPSPRTAGRPARVAARPLQVSLQGRTERRKVFLIYHFTSFCLNLKSKESDSNASDSDCQYIFNRLARPFGKS